MINARPYKHIALNIHNIYIYIILFHSVILLFHLWNLYILSRKFMYRFIYVDNLKDYFFFFLVLRMDIITRYVLFKNKQIIFTKWWFSIYTNSHQYVEGFSEIFVFEVA